MSVTGIPACISVKGGGACWVIVALTRALRSVASLSLALMALLLASVSAEGAAAPVTAQALEALKSSFAFQPVELRPEDSLFDRPEKNTENVIQLERMIVMESVTGRGVTESLDKQEMILKRARFDWETGGFYYQKAGRRFTTEAGVWLHGESLTFLTVAW